MAIFSSLNFGVGRLGGTILYNYLSQAAFASIAIPLKTTVFYDLAAAFGFLSSAIVSLYWPDLLAVARHVSQSGLSSALAKVWTPLQVLSMRQIVMGGMIATWALRFGALMGHRMYKHGQDVRFDEIKINPKTFAGAFTGQATWIMVSGLPFWLVNTIPVGHHPRFGTISDLSGVAVWIVGFTVEVLADHQKVIWRNSKDAKRHDEKFITSGLWSWSRHPNYVGEIILWGAMPLLAASPLLANIGTQSIIPWFYPLLACAPPIFEYFALAYATGVPPLEEIAEKKWGDDPSWQEYKRNVPVLFGWPVARA